MIFFSPCTCVRMRTIAMYTSAQSYTYAIILFICSSDADLLFGCRASSFRDCVCSLNTAIPLHIDCIDRPSENKMLERLPIDALLKVAGYLSLPDLARLTCTCREVNHELIAQQTL